jgi:hypothetical protein
MKLNFNTSEEKIDLWEVIKILLQYISLNKDIRFIGNLYIVRVITKFAIRIGIGAMVC